MHRSLRSWAIAVSFFSFAGCGSNGGSAPSTFSDHVDALARAECAGIFRCVEFVSPEVLGDLFLTTRGLGDVERCAELVRDERVAPAEREAIEAAIEEGRIVFDAEAARDCNDAISSDICLVELASLPSVLARIDASCAQVLVGTVDETEPCLLDEECAPGLTCQTNPGTCGGTCAPVDSIDHQVALGGDCSSTDDCVYGAICSGTCKLLSIIADQGVGDSCMLEETDATNLTLRTCEAGLGCAVDDGVTSCVEPLAAGADCTDTPTAPCVADHACLTDPSPATTRSCRAIHVATEVGADCTRFGEYTGGDVTFCDGTLGLYCGSTGTCVSAGDGSLGSHCVVEGEDAPFRAPCAPGLYCEDEVTGECAAKKPATEPCAESKECLSDLCLEGVCAESYCDTTDLVI